MKKLVVLSGGLVAIGSAALVGAGIAVSQPGGSYGANVIDEPYGRAIQILKSQGVTAVFGGKTGSVLQQSQCLVSSQKLIKSSSQGNRAMKMQLFLDCSQAAADKLEELGAAGGPRVGSNGVTTVTPTPVVPIQGAPGAGTPPPLG
ncbi:hypothetical protein BST36_09465 [Mycolicibacterium moriokaense]|uniref:PASTA domain-containing protein n=1 Tax=Mycolicibacterium moriokaense TaxID=39691 RepID=A0AAD1M6T3_9MYCO|nr:hypothetical protein [Mycolicibacterium moriokaense]MCV7038548.1 hypothetical protein [Mycolicibacterium moriokaense]ORB24797.1 hypothetical protein BST36_09465 [Mycolicibacterium moriokaense]BBX02328.1 hypothetical protein MMOR_32640 [Mycolicibacterium moriokaense]